MSSFFSALVGSYSQLTMQRELMEQQREDKQKQAEISALGLAMDSGRLTDEGFDAAMSRIEELSGAKGKKGQESPLRSVLTKLRGKVPPENRYQPAGTLEQQVAAQGKTPAGIYAAGARGMAMEGPEGIPGGAAKGSQAGITRPHAYMTSQEMMQRQAQEAAIKEGPQLELEQKKFEEEQAAADKRFDQQLQLEDIRDQARQAAADIAEQRREMVQNQRDDLQMRLTSIRERAQDARSLRAQGVTDDRQTKALLNVSINETINTLRAQFIQAGNAAKAAQAQLAKLGVGVWARGEGAIGLGPRNDIQANILAYQSQAAALQKAMQYMAGKRQQILNGTVDIDAVSEKVNEITSVGADTTGLHLTPVQ